MGSHERLIPERTIDSLLAAELVRHDPYALIWSPSQFDDAADHVLYGERARFGVLECKAVSSNASLDPTASWKIEIKRTQLNDYAHLPYPVMYLFLAQPVALRSPEYRPCSIGPCAGRTCQACCRDTRTWGSLTSHVQSSPLPLRLQPWFCHWAWVITARDLLAYYDRRITSWKVRTVYLDDSFLWSLPGATRLCHAFHEIAKNERWTVTTEFLAAMMRDVHWPQVSDEDPGATPPMYSILSSGSYGG
jgi:hypothetical protein